jgi:hypothetical protein
MRGEEMDSEEGKFISPLKFFLFRGTYGGDDLE